MILRIFILSLIGFSVNIVSCEINMTKYYQLPKLGLLDNYDQCLLPNKNHTAVYCYVQVVVKPNNHSDIWSYINEISLDKKHYLRHDLLTRGLCLDKCREHFIDLVPKAKLAYYENKFEWRGMDEFKLDYTKFKGNANAQMQYGELINECVNWELKRNYNLTAYSRIEYCITNRSSDNEFEIDFLDKLFVTIISVIVILLIASTYYDYMLNKWKNPDHYRVLPLDTKTQMMVTFSIYRNVTKLNQKSKMPSLNSIEAIRVLFMIGVIAAHVFLMYMASPHHNYEFWEIKFHQLLPQLMINGTVIIQTYYTISGFLVAFSLRKFCETIKNIQFSHFFKFLIDRYFRLTPVYMLIILFDMSWLVRLQDGPFWRHFNELERNYCRANWWTNILFINNYVNASEPCLQQGWYLGTDFQLFTISLFCLVLILKNPWLKTPILVFWTGFSFVVPAIVTYVNRYEGIFMTYLESLRYILWYDQAYHRLYIPAYTNTGGYMIGVIAGWIYYNFTKNNIDIKKHKWFISLWMLVIPIGVSYLLTGYIFFNYEFTKPALWIALYSGLAKNIWGILMAILIFGLASGIGWFVKDFLSMRLFRLLGRTTFCVYLVHVIIIRITLNNMRTLREVSIADLATFSFAAVSMSYLCGILLCLLVEMPIANVHKIILRLVFPTIYHSSMNGGSDVDGVQNCGNKAEITINCNNAKLANVTDEYHIELETKSNGIAVVHS